MEFLLLDNTTTIDLHIGGFVDFIIGVLSIVGAFFGYRRGVIVECISIFAVLVLLTICVNISKHVYSYLSSRSDVPDLFAIILMTIFFILGLMFLITRVDFKTQTMLKTTILGPSARYLGAFFGALKWYLIMAVFLVTLFKVEEHAKFLPDDAKQSRISRGSIWIITSIFPYLQLDRKDPRPFEYPNNEGQNN